MDRCPNCRARLDVEPTCRRCGMELALLQRVERAADAALREAIALLAAGDSPAAGDAAGRAAALRRTDLAERIAVFLSTIGPDPNRSESEPEPEPEPEPDDAKPAGLASSQPEAPSSILGFRPLPWVRRKATAMIDLLERSTVPRKVASLSVEGYQRLRDLGLVPVKSELRNGMVVEKAAKSPLHTLILHRLYDHLAADLPASLQLRKQEPLTLSASELEPDIAIVAGSIEDYRDRHPETALLVAEVAVSSSELDRAKADLYAQAGVPSYWLVSPAEGTVEVYTGPGATSYENVERHGAGQVLSTWYGATIDIDALFA
jgi:Uma2 family endonuclease